MLETEARRAAMLRHPATLSKELGWQVRPRTARRFVILFIVGWLIAAALTTAGVVKADTERELVQYAVQHEALICGQLAADPTVDGLDAVLMRVEFGWGFDSFSAGSIVRMAVQDGCPCYLPVLAEYLDPKLLRSENPIFQQLLDDNLK